MEEGGHPAFTYSIGIEKSLGQPEIIVTGLKQEIAHWIANEYNNRAKAGEVFISDQYFSDFLEGFEVTFKEVEQKHYSEYFGWGNWLYGGNDFKVLQLIYPNTSGIWPLDTEAPEEFKWFLPRLYKLTRPLKIAHFVR